MNTSDALVSWEGLSPPYSTIVADPPWRYDSPETAMTTKIKRDGTPGRHVGTSGYSRLDLAEIAALDVVALAASNAHLYLWATNSFVSDAWRIAMVWGFTPKTILTWVKTHQDDPHRVSMKSGHYFRGATEHVVFAVRGSLPLTTTGAISTAFLAPRIGAHSVKPPAFFDLVTRASPGPYVELFARTPQLGWDSWGYGYESRAS